MIKPNFMEKLLEGVEVEWKSLGQIGELVRGSGLQKSDFTENGVGCIHYGQIYTYYGNYAYETKSFVSPTLATKLRKAQKGDLIIATTSENIEDVCKPLVWLGEEEVCVSGETYILKHNQNPKYLAYYLQTPIFFDYKKQNRTGTKVTRVHGDKLEKFELPIPPLEVQKEIVRILDAFTELTAELTARNKQYEYYRDKLLTFEEGNVEWKRLGDEGEFIYGYAAKAQDSGDARFIRITDINMNGRLIPIDAKFVDISEENERFILEKDDLLMARTGATFGKTMIFEEDYPAIFAGFLIKLSFDKKNINSKYYWHFAQSELFWHQANKLVSGGGQPQFNANAIREVKIPIPYPDNPDKSLAEQARIVSILDKFDALTSSITEGFSREINLRQKQYEYYRNRLLSFPRSEVEA